MTLLCASGARAQVVEGGIKAGVALATITDLEDSFTVFCIALVGVECPTVSNEGRVGATAGGFVTLRLGDTFALQSEALFTQKGTSIRLDSDVLPASLDLDLDVDIRLLYLEFPVMARFDLARGPTGVYLLGGPVFGIRTSASSDGGPGTLFADFTADFEDGVKRFELGATVGAGVTRGRLLLEGRFAQGLSDVNEPSLGLARDVRNRTFAILGGVRF